MDGKLQNDMSTKFFTIKPGNTVTIYTAKLKYHIKILKIALNFTIKKMSIKQPLNSSDTRRRA